MATFTSFLNLRKPASGDLVTVSTDIGANMDLIDAELSSDETRLGNLEAVNAANGIAIKPADESVTSSTVLQNDDDLFTPTLAVGTYIIDICLILSGDQAADIQIQHTFTGSMTASGYNQGSTGVSTTLSEFSRLEGTSADNVSPVSNSTLGVITGNTTVAITHHVVIVTVAGVFRLQWAQGTSNATATVVKKGSHMVWRKVA